MTAERSHNHFGCSCFSIKKNYNKKFKNKLLTCIPLRMTLGFMSAIFPFLLFNTFDRQNELGVIAKVRTLRTNERTLIWHFTPPSLLKPKCDRQWKKCMPSGSKMQSPRLRQWSSFATHKGVHKTLAFVRRCPIKYPSSPQPAPTWTCFNAVSVVMHAGTLTWKFSVNCEMSKETISNSWRIRFLLFFFFSFSASVKAGGWCRSTHCRTGVSAFWQRLQKRNRHLRLIDHVRMCAPTALEIG